MLPEHPRASTAIYWQPGLSLGSAPIRGRCDSTSASWTMDDWGRTAGLSLPTAIFCELRGPRIRRPRCLSSSPLPGTGIGDCGRRWTLGKPSVGQPSPSSIHALKPPSGGRDAIVAWRLGGVPPSLQGTIMVIPRVVVPTKGSVVSERCGSKLKCRYAGPCVRRGICLRAKSEWQALIGNCFHAAWPLRIAAPSKSGPSYSLGARARAALNRLGQHTHECPRRFRSRPTISLGGFDVV